MRERTSASQACGSIPFILAVTIRLYMAAARRPPRSDPQKSHDFRPNAMPLSTTLADLVYAAILCRDFFGSAGIAEAVA
jgi:hypothetical protein